MNQFQFEAVETAHAIASDSMASMKAQFGKLNLKVRKATTSLFEVSLEETGRATLEKPKKLVQLKSLILQKLAAVHFRVC